MIKLAVIADDLTGANDTAVQFAKHRIRSCVKIDFTPNHALQEESEVVVIDTDSRDIPAPLARQKVKEVCAWLRSRGVADVYKKVDSTLRGNLGAEIEAAAEVFAPELVIIAPAFPNNKRITVGGYHLLDCVPLELTEIARAPKSPVRESRVVELLKKQTDNAVALIPLHIIMQGSEAIRREIARNIQHGFRWLVFDAIQNEDLQSIVHAAQGYDKILWVGSAGLADYLPQVYRWSAYIPAVCRSASGNVLVICGSVSKVTQRQIEAVVRYGNVALVKLDIAAMFSDEAAEVARCTAQALRWAEAGQHVVIAASCSAADIELAVRIGSEQRLSGEAVSERLACVLGRIGRALASYPWAGMVLTGGDTAIHVCRALEAESIDIVREVAVGIPLGCMRGGICDGVRVVTKAGAFGEDDSLIKSIEVMQ